MNRFRLMMLAVSFLYVASHLAGCTQSEDEQIPSEVHSDERLNAAVPYSSKSADLGRDLYKAHCRVCHGEQGEGDGPASYALELKPQPFSTLQRRLDDQALFLGIANNGYQNHQWRLYLKSDDIRHVVNFIRSQKE